MWLIVGTIFLIVGINISFNIITSKDRDIYGMALFFVILSVIGVVMVECQISDIITCYTIPEKRIFEYLVSVLISES